MIKIKVPAFKVGDEDVIDKLTYEDDKSSVWTPKPKPQNDKRK